MIMKRFSLLFILLLATFTSTFANSDKKDYYFKTTVVASGAGKVYASTSADATPEFRESITVEPEAQNASSAPTVTIYLWAQPEEGMKVEWVSDFTITPLSEDLCTASVEITGNEEQGKVNLIAARFYNPQKAEGSLVLKQDSLSLIIGDTESLAIESQSHKAAISWSSSNEAVVSIAEDGTLTANEEGMAVITVELAESDEYQGATATCLVIVEKPLSPYQVQNSGFELWDEAGTVMQEPSHWNSFQHVTGSMASMVKAQQVAQSDDVRPGSNGTSSAYIYSRNVMMGIAAQGNLTTGCINGGSMTASDASGNYNYTNVEDPDFHQRLTGLPDSLRIWVKYQPKDNTTQAKITAKLHTEGYFQDPLANEEKVGETKCVANVDAAVEATDDEWVEVTVPFTYELTDGTRPAFALISFATCTVPGGGSTSDKMYIDDLSLIYNSELTAVVIDGKEFAVQGNSAEVTANYDPETIQLLTNAQGATVESNYDETAQTLTVVVKGDNISEDADNQHTYSIHFTTPTGVRTPVAETKADVYDLSGRKSQRAQRKQIFLVNGKKVAIQ